MTAIVFAVSGNLNAPTFSAQYARKLLDLFPAYDVQVTCIPMPSMADHAGERAALGDRLFAMTAANPDKLLLLDGACAASMLMADTDRVLPGSAVALCHHLPAQDGGQTDGSGSSDVQRHRAAFGKMSRVIATSRVTEARLIHDFGLPAGKVALALPGIDPASRATGTGTPLQLLAVGAVSRQKRYDVLIEALARLSELDWRLMIAGALDREPEAASQLTELIARHGLGDRVKLTGQVVPATLDRLFASADVFVMPSEGDGYSLSLAEAMARGLPIVCGGASQPADQVPDGAASKVVPGDVTALSLTLASLLQDRKLRGRLADASWDAGRRLPTWNETARRVVAALLSLDP